MNTNVISENFFDENNEEFLKSQEKRFTAITTEKRPLFTTYHTVSEQVEENTPIEKGATILGLYKIKSDAIAGGMGRVFRVHHTGWKVDLAMKQPKRELFMNEKQKAVFTGECKHWIELGLHPHIVSCYYVREIDGIPSIFAEWMDGGSLKGFIESEALYEGSEAEALKRILDISIQFARGLQYAHEKGLIHQDVKPDNLLLTAEGTAQPVTAKVADFGIAGARAMVTEMDTVSAGSATIIVKGGAYTPAYCSPEQKVGGKLTRRTDIWSWAVSVLEMFMGERLWLDGTVAGYACEDYFGAERIAMPAAMQDLLRWCFKANEAERPHDFEIVEAELLKIYRAETGSMYPRPASKAASHTADSLNNRALSYLDLGEPEEAEKCWKEALAIDPGHAACLYNLNVHLWRSAKITDSETIRRIVSNTTDAGYYLAMIHMARGDAESAMDCLNRAMEKEGETERIHHAMTIVEELISNEKDGKCLQTFDLPGEYLMTVCFNPDESNVLAGGECLWKGNIANGQCTDDSFVNKRGVQEIAFSPDRTEVLLGGSYDGTMKLWDIATKQRICSFKGHSDIVSSVSFSPDGKRALSGSRDQSIRLWDTATGECIRTFTGNTDPGLVVCLSPDGHTALSGDYSTKVKLWETSSGACIRTFEGHTDWISSVCFSPDGYYALSGSHDHTMKLWDTQTGECLQTFMGGVALSVCFSPDGKRALSGDLDQSIRLWDVLTGVCIRTFGNYPDFVKSVCFSTNGKNALGCSIQTIKLWSIPDVSIDHDTKQMIISRIHSTEISSKNKELFNALAEETDRLIDNKKIREALYKIGELRKLLDFGDLHSYDAIVRRLSAYCTRNSMINQRLQIIDQDLTRRLYHHSCSFSADGRKALSAGYRSISLWDISAGRCIRTFETNVNYIESVCFSPGENSALLGCSDHSGKTMQLWDLENCKFIRSFHGHTDTVNAVCFSPDGSKMLSGSNDKTVKLWDAVTGDCIRTFKGHLHWVKSVCFHPDGSKILSASSDETVKLWDMVTGECMHTFIPESVYTNTNSGYNYTACFSPDGYKILSKGGFNSIVKLWDISSRACIGTFEKMNGSHICISPDGNWLLSQNGNDIEVLNRGKEESIQIFKGHTSPITSFCFSPDGMMMISASDNGILVYNLDYDLAFPGWHDWDEGARPYLNIFLTRYPNWTDDDLNHILIPGLQNRGYGWLRPEGVKDELEKLKIHPFGGVK